MADESRVEEVVAVFQSVNLLPVCHAFPYLQRLVHPYHLGGVGVGLAIGGDNAVGAEGVVVANAGQAAQVAAHGIPFSILPWETLVHPVPDESALQLRVAVDGVPVAGESAHAVAHGVAVLSHDIRPVIPFGGSLIITTCGSPAVFREVVQCGVHHLDDVRVPVQHCPFIGDGASGVFPLQVAVGALGGDAVAALVAQRPGDDRRVVAVAFVHVVDAVEHGLYPVLALGQAVIAIALGVRLDVGLVPHIEAVLVAQLIPVFIVGVVACAHGVDAHLLHHLDVVHHLIAGHVLTPLGAMLVAVDAADGHGLAVDAELLDADDGVLEGVFLLQDGHIAESHFAADTLDDAAGGVLQSDDEGVEIGGLGGPGMHLAHGTFFVVEEAEPVLHLVGLLNLEDCLALGVAQYNLQVHALAQLSREVDHHVELPLAGLLVDGGIDAVVRQVGPRHGVKAHVAGDAAHAPHVLAFEVAAVAEADDLHGHLVATAVEVLGDVPLGGTLRVFGIAHGLSVDEEVHGRAHRAELHQRAAAPPAVGQVELAHIAPRGIEVGGGVGRVGGELIAHVEVDGHPVALQLDIPRHLDVAPAREVEPQFVEPFGTLVGALVGVELPCAVEAAVEGRLLVAQTGNIILVGVGHNVGMRRLFVAGKYPNVVPCLLRARHLSRTQKAEQQ